MAKPRLLSQLGVVCAVGMAGTMEAGVGFDDVMSIVVGETGPEEVIVSVVTGAGYPSGVCVLWGGVGLAGLKNSRVGVGVMVGVKLGVKVGVGE